MAIELYPKNENTIELEEFIEYAEKHVDMRDQKTLIEAAPYLKALSNNKTFLADKINEELMKIANFQEDNLYGAQVLMLGRKKKFFMRACFWPSENEKSYQQSGPDAFFYYLPHDHNFNFLSVGYYGPGYTSEYYTYDHDKVTGMPGEKLDLRFVKKSRLEQGKVMLYRAKTDVHYQIPPESFSVSLNLMEDSVDLPRINQYRFDIKGKSVNRIINRNSGPVFASIASELGNSNTIQLLNDLSTRSKCERTKTAIVISLSKKLPECEQIDFLIKKLEGKNSYFDQSIRRHISLLEQEAISC
jgi:hypothetical protein